MTARLKGELLERGDEIRATVERNLASNFLPCGSVARGEECPDSDIDILVDPSFQRNLLDLAKIEIELEEMLGRDFDVRNIRNLYPRI